MFRRTPKIVEPQVSVNMCKCVYCFIYRFYKESNIYINDESVLKSNSEK